MNNSALSYLKTLSRDKYVASILPTSKYGVEKVCDKIDFSNCKLIVEYGPAAGVFSRYLLKKIPKDATLILIERNTEFVNILKKSLTDQRVIIVNDSAENIVSIIKHTTGNLADYIVSGIPFTFFPTSLRDDIISKSHASLNPGGKFLAYQTFYQKDEHLQDYLKKHFSTVNNQYELLNIPPLRIYEAIR